MHIPRCMSTQHPDNVAQPFFVENGLIGGEDEIQEAYYSFSHLGCDEQMWDFEGKEVDTFVVKKLLTKNEQYFREKILGRDVRLTLRVPNPEVERTEAKILLETLESIPRSFDAAQAFYGGGDAPIFEVILPMTTSAASIDRVYRYYSDVVAGKQWRAIRKNDISIADWIGAFKPERINVIPLFEDKERMFASAGIVREYLADKQVEYQRVFLARSDPAVNYGSVAAVLINKVALQRLHRLSQEIGIPMYPILGAGSAPFRGNLRPNNVEGLVAGYPSVQTFTVQSSFKFDNRPEDVRAAIRKLHDLPRSEPVAVDEARAENIIERVSRAYRAELRALAPAINDMAAYVPRRRRRKLHIGLFGYSRSMDELTLPRAITFTCAAYSLGVPPELLGLSALTDDDIVFLRSVYAGFDRDLRDAAEFCNPDSVFLPAADRLAMYRILGDIRHHPEHKELTGYMSAALRERERGDMQDAVVQAAHLRGFLG